MQDVEDIKVVIDEMEDLQSDCKELFHYTSIHALESIVNDFTTSDDKDSFAFRATSAFDTNDSLEMKLGYDYTLNLFSQLEACLPKEVSNDKYKITTYMNDVKTSHKFNQYSEDQIKNWMFLGENTPYVISFSRLNDNLEMWQKYGFNGNGICLVFDSKALELILEQSGMFILGPLPIVYGDRIGHIDIKQKFILMVYSIYNNYLRIVHPLSNVDHIAELKIRTLDEVCSFISPFIKSGDWHSERESRMSAIRHFHPIGKLPVIKQTEKGKYFIEIKIPIKCLTSIIIGSCVSDTDIKKIQFYAKTLGLSEENVLMSNAPLK